jgi:type I restriction enzyme S subunit
MNSFYLEELLEIKNGRDHKHLSDGNIPIYGSGGLMRLGNQFIYDQESILLPRKGTLSNIQFVNKPFWTVDTLYYTVINKEKAHPYFLYYYLKNLDLSKLNSGTGVPSMTFGAYYGVKLNIPNLDTQTKIAAVISAIDLKLELNNEINIELEQNAKTLYDYWFMQFNFPNANGKPYKSSGGEMVYNTILKRAIPKGWEVENFGKVFEVKRGTLITRETTTEGNYKVVAAGLNYSYLTGDYNREEFTITVSGSGANAGYVNFWMEKIFASDCTTVRGQNDTETFIGLYFLKTHQKYIFSQAKGSAQPHVYPSDIESLKFVISDKKTKSKFGDLLRPRYEKLKNITKQSQELTQLKDWLLPMLMNGQIKI